MSEYQYYEFRALDGPLTSDQMSELRALSSRAEITPRSFQNTYNYGDFRGNPSDLMAEYFDAHVYASNFGSMVFMVRLPRTVLPEADVAPYEAGEGVGAWTTDEHTIVEWRLDDEPSGEWVEGEGWLDRLLPVRDELARGDYRSLYIGWLSGISHGAIDDDWAEPVDDAELGGDESERLGDEATPAALEPPVPPGLGSLTGAQAVLAEFLGVDTDLIAAAAASSAGLGPVTESPERVAAWVAQLPIEEARAAVVRVVCGEGLRVQMELQSLFHRSAGPHADRSQAAADRRRTAADLLALAEKAGQERKRREAAERERARREHLAAVLTRLPSLWAEVYDAAQEQTASAYSRATATLVDLRDACNQANRRSEFEEELSRFLAEHGRRTALTRRLREAGLVDESQAAA